MPLGFHQGCRGRSPCAEALRSPSALLALGKAWTRPRQGLHVDARFVAVIRLGRAGRRHLGVPLPTPGDLKVAATVKARYVGEAFRPPVGWGGAATVASADRS